MCEEKTRRSALYGEPYGYADHNKSNLNHQAKYTPTGEDGVPMDAFVEELKSTLFESGDSGQRPPATKQPAYKEPSASTRHPRYFGLTRVRCTRSTRAFITQTGVRAQRQQPDYLRRYRLGQVAAITISTLVW